MQSTQTISLVVAISALRTLPSAVVPSNSLWAIFKSFSFWKVTSATVEPVGRSLTLAETTCLLCCLNTSAISSAEVAYAKFLILRNFGNEMFLMVNDFFGLEALLFSAVLALFDDNNELVALDAFLGVLVTLLDLFCSLRSLASTDSGWFAVLMLFARGFSTFLMVLELPASLLASSLTGLPAPVLCFGPFLVFELLELANLDSRLAFGSFLTVLAAIVYFKRE